MLLSRKVLICAKVHSFSSIIDLILEGINTSSYEALFQYRNFYWRNQGNTKSCEVTTIVDTNHFPQNLKKGYRFSLAIVVPQSGSHLHSWDRLFEWRKLSGKKKRQMKAITVKFTITHLHKRAFCGMHKYFIILLDGPVLFVPYLPFNDYSTISTILQGFLG